MLTRFLLGSKPDRAVEIREGAGGDQLCVGYLPCTSTGRTPFAVRSAQGGSWRDLARVTADLTLGSDQVRLPIVEIELPRLADLFGSPLRMAGTPDMGQNHANSVMGKHLNLSIDIQDFLQALAEDPPRRMVGAWGDPLCSSFQLVDKLERRAGGSAGAASAVPASRTLIAKCHDRAGDHREKQDGSNGWSHRLYEVALPRRRKVTRIPFGLMPEKAGVPDVELSEAEDEAHDCQTSFNHGESLPARIHIYPGSRGSSASISSAVPS